MCSVVSAVNASIDGCCAAASHSVCGGAPNFAHAAHAQHLAAKWCAVAAALRVSRARSAMPVCAPRWSESHRVSNAGEDFASSLASVRVFPTQAVQLARVGEESGRLHELLLEAAIILEGDGERTLERLLALLVPAITIFMGLMVAGLIGSVLIAY